MTEGEREATSNLGCSPPSPFMVSRVSRGKRKGGRRSGNTCPECVPDTMARGNEKKKRTPHRDGGYEAFEITCEVTIHAIAPIRNRLVKRIFVRVFGSISSSTSKLLFSYLFLSDISYIVM